MKNDTLFGKLAFQLAKHPENVAVEALGYILGRSASARRAIALLTQRAGVSVPENLAYHTQGVGEDMSRPDLLGTDDSGREIVSIEAKFWAGLTDNQPNAYINRLPQDAPSILLFVVPVARIVTLWPKLAAAAGAETSNSAARELQTVQLGFQRHMAIVSWRMMLELIAAELDAAGETQTAADVQQLQGLCNRMDEDAFQPIREQEMGLEWPRRMMQLASLIDDATEVGKSEGFIETQGLKVTPTRRGYGRYVRIGGLAVWLGVSFTWWTQFRPTPIWIRYYGKNKSTPIVRAAFSNFEHAAPRRLYVNEAGHVLIPIDLALAADRDDVLRGMVAQLREVAEHTPREAIAAEGHSPPPQEEDAGGD